MARTCLTVLVVLENPLGENGPALRSVRTRTAQTALVARGWTWNRTIKHEVCWKGKVLECLQSWWWGSEVCFGYCTKIMRHSHPLFWLLSLLNSAIIFSFLHLYFRAIRESSVRTQTTWTEYDIHTHSRDGGLLGAVCWLCFYYFLAGKLAHGFLRWLILLSSYPFRQYDVYQPTDQMRDDVAGE